MLLFFCRRVQYWDQGHNTANIWLFTAHQIVDILYVSNKNKVSNLSNLKLVRYTMKQMEALFIFYLNVIYWFTIWDSSFKFKINIVKAGVDLTFRCSIWRGEIILYPPLSFLHITISLHNYHIYWNQLSYSCCMLIFRHLNLNTWATEKKKN